MGQRQNHVRGALKLGELTTSKNISYKRMIDRYTIKFGPALSQKEPEKERNSATTTASSEF
jgi:hypothetical protein